jgi:hypothetical protein
MVQISNPLTIGTENGVSNAGDGQEQVPRISGTFFRQELLATGVGRPKKALASNPPL